MKIEDAKRLYAIGGESKEIALIYFNEDQLKERTLPKTFDEYLKIDKNRWHLGEQVLVPHPIVSAVDALTKLYLLKQEYNGDWVADWTNREQSKYVLCPSGNEWKKDQLVTTGYFLAFKSPELRDQFSANFKDLIEAAKPLLG